MNNARKYLALSLVALDKGDYDEAGILFAQCASSPKQLQELITEFGIHSQSNEIMAADIDEDDFLDGAEESQTSESSNKVVRQRRTGPSLFKIGQAIGAVIESVSSDEFDDMEEDEDLDADPDIPGQPQIPVSFKAESSDIAREFKQHVRSALKFKK